jgi:predicted CoA-binding protein
MIETIRRFLAIDRFAMVGVSHSPSEFSRALWREFRARNYDVVPVNPSAGEIDGRRCYARVQDIQPPVKAVLLMTAPAVTDVVVRDCAEAGVELVWMHRASGAGAVSPEAVLFCDAHGIAVIPGECPMMFLENTGWIHRAHGWVRRITGRYPS